MDDGSLSNTLTTPSRDRYDALAQTYNFGAETHLGGGVMSAFVFPLAAIA